MSSLDAFGSAPSPPLEGTPPGRAFASGSDHALDVLLVVRAQIAPELPEELLMQCYAIQKQFQFDRDEQLPIVHTRRLVEGFVEREATVRSSERPEGDA